MILLLWLLIIIINAKSETDVEEDAVSCHTESVFNTDIKIIELENEIRELKDKRLVIEKRIQGLQASQRKWDTTEIGFNLQSAKQHYREITITIKDIEVSLKPLFGVLSVQHLQEHRNVIFKSFSESTDVGQHSVFYDFIFGKDRSFDWMLTSFLMGVVFGYFAGLVRFIISAPLIALQYCDSVFDIPSAVVMWIVGVVRFLF